MIRRRTTLLLFLAAVLIPNASSASARQQYFDFHNSLWINLHQTLYREAMIANMPPDRAASMERLPLEQLSPGEKNTWSKAVDYYARTFHDKSLVFDDQLIHISYELTRTADESPELETRSQLPTDLASELVKAMPIYRTHWWPDHKLANQKWIERIRPTVLLVADRVVPRLEQLLQARWPNTLLRVDASYFVFAIGQAYTTERPEGHTTISSRREENDDLEGAEIVFHEGAHVLTTHLEEALATECQAQHKSCADLWHVIQFYTVGDVVKEAYAALETEPPLPSYVPYADKSGVYTRGNWPQLHAAVVKGWTPYLRSQTNFATAVHDVVAALK